MSRLRRLWATVAVVVLVGTSCGDDGDADDGASSADDAVTTTVARDDGGDAGEADDVEDDGDTGPADDASTTTQAADAEEPPGDAALPLPDTEAIVQTTATAGGGSRPLLAWNPVDGAASYLVVVYAETGEPYWSAVTETTEIHVGGPVQIDEDLGGPRIADGYTWIVYADDADGTPIASSPQRPIAP